jgi:hypothetical protein
MFNAFFATLGITGTLIWGALTGALLGLTLYAQLWVFVEHQRKMSNLYLYKSKATLIGITIFGANFSILAFIQLSAKVIPVGTRELRILSLYGVALFLLAILVCSTGLFKDKRR